MSNQSTVSVCNLALLSIGNRSQISNFQEGSTQADACSTLYSFVFEQLARTAHWNCLRRQITLTLYAAAQGTPENQSGTSFPLPPTPYLYAYLIPSDCLQARWVVPSLPASGSNPISPAMTTAATWLPSDGQIPFQVSTMLDVNNNSLAVILTNQTQAQLVYTVNNSNPQVWDSDFTAAMVASLAAYLVPALSLNVSLMSAQIKTAESIIANARARDGNEGYNTQDHIPDFIKARNAGTGYGSALYGDSWVGYWGSDISWPSY